MVQHFRAVAFSNRISACPANKANSSHVPFGDVAKNPLPVHHRRRPAPCRPGACVERGAAARRSIPARETRQSLPLREHVGSHARLPGHQRLRQQIASATFQILRPVPSARRRHSPAGRACRYSAGNPLDRLLPGRGSPRGGCSPPRCYRPWALFERLRIFAHRVEDAALAVHPAFSANAEEVVEQLIRQHLRWQRAVESPAQPHIALNALAERLSCDTPIWIEAEARLAPDPGRDGLVDGGPARSCGR